MSCYTVYDLSLIHILTFITQEEFEGKVEMQVTGDSLLTVILDICKMFGLGFKVILSTTNVITACLYKGADRSYQQSENSFVEFSPDFDNLISSNFMTDVYKRQSLYSAVQRGDITGMSFLFGINEERWEDLDKDLPLRHIHKISTVVEAVSYTHLNGF